MTQILGAAMPVERQERWYPVVFPRQGLPLNSLLLGQTLYGKWGHWYALGPNRGVTVNCTETDDCPNCKERLPSRWNGYIASVNVVTRDFEVMQVPVGGGNLLLPFLAEHGTLRGLQFLFTRSVEKRNGKVGVEPIAKVPEEKVPAEFPILDSVNRLLGLNDDFARRGGNPVTNRPMLGAPMPAPAAYASGICRPQQTKGPQPRNLTHEEVRERLIAARKRPQQG